MTTTGTFACPSCAAPLNPEGDAPEVKCPYCGSSVVVPEELRPNHPHNPQMFGATFTSDHPQVIIGQSNEEVKEEVAELLKEIPQMVAPMMQMRQQMGQFQQPYVAPRPARRRGCGCSGCLGFLIFLVIVGAIGLGVLASVSPNTVASLIAKIPGLEELKLGTSPTIITFTVVPTTLSTGTLVNIIWATDADSVRLEQSNIKGSQASLTLPAAGYRNVTVSGTGVITFKLTAFKNGQQTSQSKSITLKSSGAR